ncbi:MAG: branched-chain amino acid ABC transporter permease [Candidatus Bathyarchaeota archaeon]|nr:branched-chain amino acid ABC transporter permease [Candidatus Bathyarchaeota archaeon]
MELVVLAQAIVSGLLIGGLYALISIGLTLIFGVMRIINFAHGDLMMIAMYTTYWMFTLYEIDPYMSLIVTVPILFIIGSVIQKFLINRILEAPQTSQLFLTLGVMLIAQNVALLLWKADYRAIRTYYTGSVIKLDEVFISIPRLASFAVAIILTGLLYLFLTRTKIGRAMRATAQDREVSSLMGVNVSQIHIVAFGIGTACVGAAGTLLSTFYYISPTVGTTFTLTAFLAVVLGGMGSFTGAFFGGLIVGLAESLGAVYIAPQYRELVTFILFIFILLLKPSGLLGKSRV